MEQPRRYRFRRGAVGFSRGQLTVVIIALVVAAAGVLALIMGAELAAGGLMGAAGATIGFTRLLARGGGTPPT